MASRRKDPLFSAAVLKLSFRLRGQEATEAFRFVYDGVLRDLGITDADVEAYIAAHRAAVEQAVRGQVKE
jgi:hypothetical protein